MRLGMIGAALLAVGGAGAGWAQQETAPAPAATVQGAAAPAATVQGELTVELNKLEPGEGDACRAFFLFRNDTGATLEGFEMSLAILDAGGVIDRLLTVDAAPLPAGRTTLKLFEIPQTGCDDISEVLLHDVPSCKPQNADEIDCFDIMRLESRADAKLVK